MVFRVIKVIAKAWVALFYRVKVEGLENFPAEGPIVVCANHTFIKDMIFIGRFAPRKINWIAKAELFRVPVFGAFIKSLGAFPVNRGANDRESVRTVYKILRSGEPLGIFPEGHRSLDPNERLPFKRGFVSFAANTGAAVLPVAIRYEDGPFGRGKLFSKATLIFGDAVHFGRGQKHGRDELIDASRSIESWIREKITIN